MDKRRNIFSVGESGLFIDLILLIFVVLLLEFLFHLNIFDTIKLNLFQFILELLLKTPFNSFRFLILFNHLTILYTK